MRVQVQQALSGGALVVATCCAAIYLDTPSRKLYVGDSTARYRTQVLLALGTCTSRLYKREKVG